MGFATVCQCLVLAAAVVYINASDEVCKDEIKTFAQCAKSEVHEREKSEKNEAAGSIHDKLAACFTAQGCAEPDFKGPIDKDLDAQAQGQWKNVTNWWESLDTDKRHCVIAEVRGDFKEKLQECIDKKIPGFSLPGPSADSVRDPPHIKKDKKTLADHRFRIHSALRKCEKKADEVKKCLKKERNARVDKETCDTRKKCAASLSANCQTSWRTSFKEPICGCVTEVAQALRKSAQGDVKQDDAVKLKCGVDLPQVDVNQVKREGDLHQRIKDYVSLFEDRIVPFCNDCEGVSV